MIALVIIGALGALALPIGKMVKRKSQQSACLNTLRGLGVALEGYLIDHQGRYPDIQMGRSSKGGDPEVLEVTLLEYAGSATSFRCPADHEHYEKSGSSYFWNETQSGLRYSQLGFMGIDRDSIPLIYDKEAFHGEENGTNFLYADQSVNQKIDFNVDSK
ncbi:hypothetical protein N9A94_06510 [Akkermansiaceae bacterium]|nr:hypothetical protein [Akkermansiaceae bacterium]